MRAPTEFLTGVIEGYYGRAWPPELRLAYADYLCRAGLNTYIYCPKGDPYLRKQWQHDWPAGQWQDLTHLSAHYRRAGIHWGVGLSPFELYRHYGAQERQQLQRKVESMAPLEAPVLAILFDDMPGELDALAARQAEIVTDVCRWSPGTRIMVCPTYYSFDPVLEKYFGKMPSQYWPQLGRELPDSVDIFWTGNRVCSESIVADDIRAITGQLGRRVMLWDNYPVNDGAVRSNFLYCEPLSQRGSDLRPLLSGHLCNPMNQGLLSLPALSGLAQLYGATALGDDDLGAILGPRTWEKLRQDQQLFRQEGLAGLGEERCAALAAQYSVLPGPAAQEVAGWLRGEYHFDPACLTD
jgi:hyaluronoglucosaminidase